jgi:hypothetical protein
LDAALARGPGPARTLGGCRIGWQAGRIMVCREAAAAGEVLVLGPGLRATWDRRFAVSVSGNMPRRLRLARLGEATGRLGDAARRAPRAALACRFRAMARSSARRCRIRRPQQWPPPPPRCGSSCATAAAC